jgi:O-antigen/teichoic acid export membrane protein
VKINYFFVRVLSVITDFLLGFAQPFIFLKIYHNNNSAYLLWIFGISTYLMFFDFGFTKVSYARIRNLFLNNGDYKGEVHNTLRFLYKIWILLLAIFTILVFSMSAVRGTTLTTTELAFISITIPLNILFVFLRQIYSAIDKFKRFEYFDIFRKGINFTGYFVLLYTGSLKIGFGITIAGMILIGSYMIFYLVKHHTHRLSQNYKTERFNYAQIKTSLPVLIFTVAETFIYNGGFFYLPLLKSNNYNIIYYSLWIKIFTGMAVFMRTINDSFIPGQTRAYFTNNIPESNRLFNKSFYLSLAFCAASFTAFLLLNKVFMFYWTSNKYQFDYLSIAAILIMLVGNSMQHVAGSFLMDIGGHYTFMRNCSVLIFIILAACFIFSFQLYQSIYITIIASTMVYFLGSFIYFNKAKRVLTQ